MGVPSLRIPTEEKAELGSSIASAARRRRSSAVSVASTPHRPLFDVYEQGIGRERNYRRAHKQKTEEHTQAASPQQPLDLMRVQMAEGGRTLDPAAKGTYGSKVVAPQAYCIEW